MFVVANTSARPPQKECIFIAKITNYWIEVSEHVVYSFYILRTKPLITNGMHTIESYVQLLAVYLAVQFTICIFLGSLHATFAQLIILNRYNG